jgi:hypothetical protein
LEGIKALVGFQIGIDEEEKVFPVIISVAPP